MSDLVDQREGRDVEAWRFEVLDRYSAAINRHIAVGASIGRTDLALRQLELRVADMEQQTERMEARVARVLGTDTTGRSTPAGTGE